MRKIALLLFSLVSICSFAQSDALIKPKKSRLYFDVGMGFTYATGFSHISLSYVSKNNWGVVLENGMVSRPTEEKPSAFEYTKFYSLRATKFFNLKNSGKKLCVEYGVSLAKNCLEHNSILSAGSFVTLFGGNYRSYYEYEYAMGLSFRASLYKPTRRFVGFQLSGVANINPYTPFVGVELNLRLGK